MFAPDYLIADLRPADYNPRSIDDAALQALCESLKTLGIIKPVVALKDGLIVAGHQRTRAAKLAGLTHTPVCFLSKAPSPADEIRFNQLHNGTDLDSGAEKAVVQAAGAPGFDLVDLVSADYRAVGASTRAELARMLTAYGNWGGCVASLDGRVLTGASYALAASAIGMKVRTCFVDDERAKLVSAIFAKAYGRYDYAKVKRQTYNQTFAQMFRLREGAKRGNESPTYKWLLGRTPKTTRLLDFGCGQGDYVRSLRAQGYDIQGMEFFRRKGSALDVSASQRMIDALILSIKTRGLFDSVICDYVLNSVDTQQAEDDVMACVNAFCKPGGRIFISGRTRDRLVEHARMTKSTAGKREAEFLDKDGISGLFRAGEWFFQKFHNKTEVAAIVGKHFREDAAFEFQKQSVSWQATFLKGKASPGAREGIEREFNLPLPNGRSFNRQAEVLSVMESFL